MRRKKITLSMAALAMGIFFNASGALADSYVVENEIVIEEAGIYSLQLAAEEGNAWAIPENADVTSWFVYEDGKAAFSNDNGAAIANYTGEEDVIQITIDTEQINSFTKNGSGDLYIQIPSRGAMVGHYSADRSKVGSIVVPEIMVDGDIYGSAFTNGCSTLKAENGISVTYEEGRNMETFSLELEGLDPKLIDGSSAQIQLKPGDAYGVDELVLKPDRPVTEDWADGKNSFIMTTGDLEWNNYDYGPIDNGGREWSCIHGDGSGRYVFNLGLSGLRYRGLLLADADFQVRIYIYGNDYTNDANNKYSYPLWSWEGVGEKPILCDSLDDTFTIRWPDQADASALSEEDVEITLSSAYGETYTLQTGSEYHVQAEKSRTYINVTMENFAFTPVYTTMTLTVKNDKVSCDNIDLTALSKTYDIASVYIYAIQQGGGMDRDDTVVVLSVYGLEGLTSLEQIITPVTYVLSYTDEEGRTCYYSEENGSGKLVDSENEAAVYDGMGPEDRNVRLISNSIFITRQDDNTEVKTVDGTEITFNKVYSGGVWLNPDESFTAKPGYVFPTGLSPMENGWAMHEKWAWQQSILDGWTKDAE